MDGDGLVALDRVVDTIDEGIRIRTDPGDLTTLCDSIAKLGLLQPITITPDGLLICGFRRLRAVKALGWRTVKVWVRSGIATDVERLLAEHDENVVRQSFSPLELARMYEALKRAYADEANIARNTRERDANGRITTGPKVGPVGKSGRRAAEIVTGKRSEVTLERVLEIERIADDPAAPDAVRAIAAEQVEVLGQSNNVAFSYGLVKRAEAIHELQQSLADEEITETMQEEIERRQRELEDAESGVEMMTLAKAAMKRAREARRRPGAGLPADAPVGRYPPINPGRWVPRAFVSLLNETDYWWLRVDPQDVGAGLTSTQWDQFEDWVGQAVTFRNAARAHRKA
ncbi:MAG: ParB N-terminal domain-containing protein [Microbacteriaceae bacterium]